MPPEHPASEVAAWRKLERQRLIELRLAISAEERAARGADIAAQLDAELPDLRGRLVSLYWPFRGEPDLRAWAASVIARGGRICLPVVVAKGYPLVFRLWTPGDRLEKGVWNIPIPAEGAEVQPDIVVSPLVGFDRQKFRLGYGGGFYDRTLAALPARPQPVVGVGYRECEIPTIQPQPHDIPMDRIVAV